MTSNAWSSASCTDMDTIYKAHLDPADKKRIEALEMFDEFEEWVMIQEHYCITVAVNGGDEPSSVLKGFGFHPK